MSSFSLFTEHQYSSVTDTSPCTNTFIGGGYQALL